ncbi:hypothetical protein GCM10010218_50190 [Streptomyces mashuensis]|uniref:Uncharacterized protein n=1 Tax=Streptomyces mashuensis TaxID=33904 RepID=A0A919B791_9ACTN|nr:hypothetical protein [Streptomyces mashuensis]GHF62668.1 hypothetical protein GCM10010218_50190 [Streptomyces mashuensis]
MGWTHDYRDLTQERATEADASLAVTEGPDRDAWGEHRPRGGPDPRMGIPRILHRRARWVSARLRHPRSR